MSDLELWELSARENIRHIIANYTMAGDGFRIAELGALFTEDGELEVYGKQTAHGRAEIIAMLSGSDEPAVEPVPGFYIRHFVTNVFIEDLTPTTARGSAYFVVFTPAGIDHWGRYRDEYVKVDGDWKFRRRTARVDTAVEGGWYGGRHP